MTDRGQDEPVKMGTVWQKEQGLHLLRKTKKQNLRGNF